MRHALRPRHATLLLLAWPVLAAASCPGKTRDCEHESSERCLWEQGVNNPEPKLDDGEGGGEFVGVSGGDGSLDRTELERVVTDIVEIMRFGLEWPLVDQRARELCRTRDEDGELVPIDVSVADERGLAWSCPVASLELDGQPLSLEATAGVISLSSDELDALRSDELLEQARTRLEPQCSGAFEELEGAKGELFYRCPLPEGPFLVIARIPRDRETDRWQISMAILDAG